MLSSATWPVHISRVSHASGSLMPSSTSQWMEVMFGFPLRPLYLRGNSSRPAIHSRLPGPKSRSGLFVGNKNALLALGIEPGLSVRKPAVTCGV